MLSIREIEDADWDPVWGIIEPVFQTGETYPFPSDTTKDEAHQAWVDSPTPTKIAVDENGDIRGTYYIKPNQTGRGAHVCNCGCIVGEKARGRRVAANMFRHSQEVAQKLGFRAMQCNLVVSTNEGAVRLWQREGFEIVATLPGALSTRGWGLRMPM
jgi:L-amino acid N-acyltransferase YncA